VSHTPGVELVMEAYEGYCAKVPTVKRIVYKSVPEATTRLAMLKRGEVDVAYLFDGPMAEEVKRDPNLKLAFSGGNRHHLRRLPRSMGSQVAVGTTVACGSRPALAIDRKTLSMAETLGASRPTGGMVPRSFEFALVLEPHPTTPRRPRSSWPRPAIPTASTAATCTRGRHTSRRARPWPTTWPPSASGRGCARWSGPRSTRRWPARS